MRRSVAGLAVALAASACSYDFRNPAERLGTGQALGRLVVDRGAGTLPLAGALVALEHGPSFNQQTQASGRFTLLSLPVGQHRVLFRKGTQWAGERVVEIVPGDDGKPEGVNLGDVRLRYTVTVQGTLRLPAGFDPSLFSALVVDVADELSGQPAALASGPGASELQYTLRGLAVGAHRLRFAASGDRLGARVTLAAAPLTITIPETSEGQQLLLNAVTLEPEPIATGVGAFRFRIQAVGPGGAAAAAATRVELRDVALDPSGTGTAVVETLAPDSGGWVQGEAAPGLYLAALLPPPPSGAAVWEPPPPVRFLVRAGVRNELPVVYLVDALTGTTAALACFSDADCGAGGACVDAVCQGGTPVVPPEAAPATTAFCLPLDERCLVAAGGSCAGGFGQCQNDCSDGKAGVPLCAPLPAFDPDLSTTATVGLPCTPDGATIVRGQAASCLAN